ncbi:MAG: RNA helicase, partial [Bacillota bacterium]|nr:RNA helicase [Bacillota bacterium]
MNKLEQIYPQAVEHTKNKIEQDIDHYLETRPELPTFDQYVSDRKQYIEQIWVNVWLNKVTNDVPKSEKKQFLSEKGYEVHGIDRKLINKLFRDEMRTYQPFSAVEWLNETFAKHEEWEKRYQNAITNYIKREEQKKLEEQKQSFRREIEQEATSLIE